MRRFCLLDHVNLQYHITYFYAVEVYSNITNVQLVQLFLCNVLSISIAMLDGTSDADIYITSRVSLI